MAEVRKATAVPKEQTPAPQEPQTEKDTQKDGEWDGTGSRRQAVHEGVADQELVENGMTQVPLDYQGK
jgi:hypothetical protein